MSESCGQCKYWRPNAISGVYRTDNMAHHCLYHAPTTSSPYERWPSTSSNEWCGDFWPYAAPSDAGEDR